jgi:hypothetical protein
MTAPTTPVAQTVWCENDAHGTAWNPHFDSADCVNPHFTDPETRARLNEAAQYREAAAKCRRDAAESWERSDTDGFVSQWASGVTAREYELKAQIAENGGRAEFPALFDLDGNLVAAKLVEVRDRYNPREGATVSKWCVLESDDPRSSAVAWLTAFPVRKSTLARKGYTEGCVLAPARAATGGSGTGLSGALSVSVYAKRTDGGFSRDVEVVTTCRDYEKN